MANKTAKELMSRWEYAKNKPERRNHEETWEEIASLGDPFIGDLSTSKKTPGSKRVKSVLDATMMLANETFVNFLKGTIFPSNMPWLRLEPFSEELASNVEIRRALKAVEDRILATYAGSNFYVQAAQALSSFSLLGNTCFYMEEVNPKYSDSRGSTFGGFMFETVPMNRIWWVTGKGNRVVMVFRKFTLPALEAMKQFENPGSAVINALEKSPMTPVGYLQCVYEREDGFAGALVPAQNKKWASDWICLEGKDHELVRQSGYDFNPFVTPRARIVDGEEYGRWKGHIARPAASGSTEMRRQGLIGLGRVLNPVLSVEHEAVMKLNAGPSGIAVTRVGRKAPEYITPPSDFGAFEFLTNLDRQDIKAVFHGDALDDPETEPRSAEESRQRRERALSKLAAPADVIDYEFLGPIVANTVNMMRRAGDLPELAQLEELGIGVDVTFVSPFFTAQKQAAGQAEDQFVAEALQLATVDPTVVDAIDLAKHTRNKGIRSNATGILRSEEEVAQIQQARAQAQQAAQLQEALRTGADVAKALPQQGA
ncbi:MAG: hypothetical protein KDH09_03340 [Chrysiogenetes bacterium]|nr:hypothetical protein [Chrysiogenetes bacterium]